MATHYNLEEKVFSHILETHQTQTSPIVTYFMTKGYSKQGVYKVLRKLHSEGKILWQHGSVEVHLMWLQQEIDRLASAMPRKELVLTNFAHGKHTYYAKTLTELEGIYGQIFISLISSVHENVRDYLFYDVHNYTYVNTAPIVDWYIDYILKHKGNICLLVGSVSPLDLYLKKKNRMRSIHVHCIPRKWKVNFSIFGDYVISVTTHRTILERMDKIFEAGTDVEASSKMKALYETVSKHKIVVEKNPAKAQKIKNEFRKYFLIH